MLTITVGGTDVYDESTGEFRTQGGVKLQLEHSLLSLSKWEAEFEKPFLGKAAKEPEEVFSYIKAMIVTPNFPPEVFSQLSQANLEEVSAYVETKRSATWFSDSPGAPKTSEVITSELIYYWMTAFNIPFSCETWHLNRLFTLIRICNSKSAKPKKMSRAEIAQRNREINEQRKKQYQTSG